MLIESLYLTLLVNAEPQRAIGLRWIKIDKVADLVHSRAAQVERAALAAFFWRFSSMGMHRIPTPSS
jgi:hypothetical protein